MIEEHILQLLHNNNLGIIDDNLFISELPYAADPSRNDRFNEIEGVALIENGGNISDNGVQSVDFYFISRGRRMEAKQRLLDIYKYLCCEKCLVLPPVDFECCNVSYNSTEEFKLCDIKPTEYIQNLDKTAQGKWLFRMDFTARYSPSC